ncbi:MAG: hypothetical protein IJR47_01605, partial [Clostridia bacterium]|nr:hypothetical protein [Clostridia bacterium]
MTEEMRQIIGQALQFLGPFISVAVVGLFMRWFYGRTEKTETKEKKLQSNSNHYVLKISFGTILFFIILAIGCIAFMVPAAVASTGYFDYPEGTVALAVMSGTGLLFCIGCLYSFFVWRVEVFGEEIVHRNFWGRTQSFTFGEITRCGRIEMRYEEHFQIYINNQKAILFILPYVKWNRFKFQLEEKGIAIEEAFKCSEFYKDKDHYTIKQSRIMEEGILVLIGMLVVFFIACLIDAIVFN